MKTDTDTPVNAGSEILTLTTSVVSAFVQHNAVPMGEVTALIKSVYESMHSLSHGGGNASGAGLKPAVPIKKSITDEFIICLEDGRKLKMLKRYLRTRYKLSPDEYRAKWGLSADYPMVAPNYAEQRSQFAKKIGLGRRGPKQTRGRARN